MYTELTASMMCANFGNLEKEVKAFGLNVTVVEKEKTKEKRYPFAFSHLYHLQVFYNTDLNL